VVEPPAEGEEGEVRLSVIKPEQPEKTPVGVTPARKGGGRGEPTPKAPPAEGEGPGVPPAEDVEGHG